MHAEMGESMKPISSVNAYRMTAAYPKMSESQKSTFRRSKLENMVQYAKTNSPYYSKLFHGLGEDFELQDIPSTTKTELMSNFDEWVTDRNVSMAGLGEFMKDDSNDGRLFMNQYLVFTTSGSTGEPAIILYDKSMINTVSAVNFYRSLSNKEERKAFLKSRGRLASI
jgi:phenylacetate-coenzyme A ligase PaaK-like adenylate-forming protein